MTPEETAEALNEWAKLMSEGTPDVMQESALTAKALIQERIQETGQDALGVELTPYSESYRKVRQKKGYETAFKNLTFTGEMWRKTLITSEEQEGNKYVVTIGGTDQLTKDKLDGHSDDYGDILRLAKTEEEKLQRNIDEWAEELKKQAGL